MAASSDVAPKKKGSLRNRPAKPLSPKASADAASIEARRAKRNILDLTSVSLQISWESKDGRLFRRDLTEICDTYPHHRTLILQLRLGCEIRAQERPTTLTTMRGLTTGLVSFIKFLNSEQAVVPSQVHCVADIGWHIAKAFGNWMVQVHPKRSLNRLYYGALKRTVDALQNKFADNPTVGKIFEWPMAPADGRGENPAEPYPDWVYQSLAVAAIRDVKTIIQTMKRYDALLAETPAVPIYPVISLENVMAELVAQEEVFKASATKHARTSRGAFKKKVMQHGYLAQFLAASGLTPDEVMDLYWNRGAELAAHGRRCQDSNILTAKLPCFPGFDREQTNRTIIATVANTYPDWPFNMALQSAVTLLTTRHSKDPVETRLEDWIGRVAFGPVDNPIDTGISGYFAHRIFTPKTLFPLILYVQLNTGWNTQVIASLMDDLDAHIAPCIEDNEAVMIYGMKTKNDETGSDPSIIPHKSGTKNPLSVYNILRFVERIVKKFQGTLHYRSGGLWKYIGRRSQWVSVGSILLEWRTNTNYTHNYNEWAAKFITRHKIDIDSNSKRKTIEGTRVRVSWVAKQKEMGAFIEQLSVQMNHSDVDTTDNYYDNNEASKRQKDQRLRKLMNQHVADFTKYGTRIAQDCTLQELRSALPQVGDPSRAAIREMKRSMAATGLSEHQRITHLLSPQGQTYIAACSNSKSPTWPRARDFVPEGKDCKFFNKCCMCQQGVIFKEALPYIARRILDLESQRDHNLPIVEWIKEYGEEYAAWSELIERWNNPNDVASAWADARDKKVLLPLTMRGA